MTQSMHAYSSQSRAAFAENLTPFEAVAYAWSQESDEAKEMHWKRAAGQCWSPALAVDGSRRKGREHKSRR